MWDVDIELIEVWLRALDDDSRAKTVAAIELLQEIGPNLGRPLVDSIKASRHKNMKELRPISGKKSALRILFAFDPERKAIMLIAGDKAGRWTKWYRDNIPLADDIFDEHLRKIEQER